MAETFFGLTDTGRQRSNNEDAFLTEPVLNNRFLAACVIDGVGGYEGGEVAAAIARQEILNYFSVPSGSIPAMMQEAIVSANEKIYLEKSRNSKLNNMACVLTLALVEKNQNKFYYAHVGDTRLYLFRDGSLVKVTKDQSFVGFLEDGGRLSEAEAMAHPKRNEINKALGFESPLPNPSDYIDAGESPFLPGDLILLCSDGLSDLVTRGAISDILATNRSLEEKSIALVEAANNAGGKDNITVVLVQNISKRVKLKALKPTLAVKKNNPPERAPAAQPVKASPPQAAPAPPLKERKNPYKRVSVVLLLLLLVASSALFWMFYQSKKQALASTTPEATTVQKSSAEILLQDTLNSFSGDTLVLPTSLFGETIYLTDTLFIHQDFLHVRGNGTTIAADTALPNKEAVIFISPSVSHVLFDSLLFKNVSLIVTPENKNGLYFQSVLFQHTTLNVAQKWGLPDTLFSGNIARLRLRTDSLKKTTN